MLFSGPLIQLKPDPTEPGIMFFPHIARTDPVLNWNAKRAYACDRSCRKLFTRALQTAIRVILRAAMFTEPWLKKMVIIALLLCPRMLMPTSTRLTHT